MSPERSVEFFGEVPKALCKSKLVVSHLRDVARELGDNTLEQGFSGVAVPDELGPYLLTLYMNEVMMDAMDRLQCQGASLFHEGPDEDYLYGCVGSISDRLRVRNISATKATTVIKVGKQSPDRFTPLCWREKRPMISISPGAEEDISLEVYNTTTNALEETRPMKSSSRDSSVDEGTGISTSSAIYVPVMVGNSPYGVVRAYRTSGDRFIADDVPKLLRLGKEEAPLFELFHRVYGE
ncbi:MAG: hypothetical protein ISS36_02175 [Candidatus Aenigmarchaeota archaeon]|nr:hypothetical protein [Candidatus Aenigmarchaeota archaeon]